MRTGIWLVALLCAPGMVWGQPLPVAEGPVTAGIVEGQRIQARQMQDSLSTLVDAVNELHRRTQELEGQLADQAELQRQVEALASRWIDTPEVHTIGAGGDFPNLNAAFEYLADKRLARAAEVRFEVRAGEHMHAEPVVIDHPDAARVFIEGVGDRSVLRFATGGMVVRDVRLGGLAGVVLRGPGAAAGLVGLEVDAGRTTAEDLTITDFDVGLLVQRGAQFAGAEVSLQRHGSACARVATQGHLQIGELVAQGCTDGLLVDNNSRADVGTVEISDVLTHGVKLTFGSTATISGGGLHPGPEQWSWSGHTGD